MSYAWTQTTAAPVLFRLAKQAYQRTCNATSDTEPTCPDALVAIVFSAATLEAFINELTEDAAHIATHLEDDVWSSPELAKLFVWLSSELEPSRLRVELKYQLVSRFLGSKAFDKGSEPYQSLALLLDLRNWLVHSKPRDRFEINEAAGGEPVIYVKQPELLRAYP